MSRTHVPTGFRPHRPTAGATADRGGGERRRSARLAAWWLVLVALPPAAFAGDGAKKRVLLLNSYHAGYIWSDQIIAAVRSAFEKSGMVIDLEVEHMDTKRHAPERIFPHLERLYEVKYLGQKLDVVIASDDNALDFLLSRREKLFPGVPVVFCGINNFQDALIQGHRQITGVAEDFDLKGTLDMALRLHPGAKRAVFVSDSTATGQINMQRVRQVMGQYKDVVSLVELIGLTTAELKQALADLPEDSVVFHMHFLRDRDGRTYSARESVALVEAYCDRPIYTMWEHRLGPKTLGGVVTGGAVQGENVARMALRILRGESADAIPVLRECPTRPMFNYAQLRRLGLRESDLPEGTVFFNRPFSIYAEYRRWIWGTASLLAALLAWIGVLTRSVMKRRRAEQALQERNQLLRSMIESSPLAMVGMDREGKITLWSPAAEKVIGWRRQEVLGRFLPAVPAERREGFLATLRDILAGEYRTGLETQGRTRDGSILDLSVSAAPIHDATGRIVGMMAVAEDITGRKRAEQERRELELRIQHAQKLESLGVLAGGIAHDFNNLLVGVLGQADLLLAEMSPDSALRPGLQEIKRAAVRASELTNQMLAYSGKGQFVVESIDLNDLLREIGQLLRVSISKKVELRYDLAEGLPPVRADASQIRQVVMNLVTNASDAIGDREGVISLRSGLRKVDAGCPVGTFTHEEPPPGDYVCLEVSDTGCGMDGPTRQRLFEPFFTTKFAGRGLGMAAVLGIVRGHGGAIEVQSEPGKGATFRVLLPCCGEPPAERPEPAAPSKQWRGRGTVLVVDDEPTVCKVARSMLERLGFTVLTAGDGQEGIETFRRRADEIVAVLLDMTMPRMSGQETFREIQRIRPGAKVVLASGYSEQDATGQFDGSRPAAFIHKPFDLAELTRTFQEVLAP